MRTRVVVLGVFVAVVVVAGWWMFAQAAVLGKVAGDTWRVPALLTAVALSLVVPGLVGSGRRPDDRASLRLVAAGLVVAVGSFRQLESSWAATVGAAVWYAAPFAVLWVAVDLAGADRPRLGRRRGAWIVPIVLAVALISTSGPRTLDGGILRVPERRSASWVFFDRAASAYVRQANPLAWWPQDNVVSALWVAWGLWVMAVTSAAAIGFLRLRREQTITRRAPGLADASVLAAWLFAAASVALALPERLSLFGTDSLIVERWYSELLQALPLAAAAVVGAGAVWSELVRPRLSRSAAGTLQLGAEATPAARQRELVRALSDPTALLLFQGESGWLDEHGTIRELAVGAHRAAAVICRDGSPIAAIEYDDQLLGQPDLVEVAATSVALSLDGRRLAAVAEAAAEDARASAARLLAAGDEGRLIVERQIVDGPDRVLGEVSAMLTERPLPLSAIHGGLRAALAEVRAVAHGSTPLSLTEDGLAAALDDLSLVSLVPLHVGGAPAQRLPPAVEVTVYLVVADAVMGATSAVRVVVSTGDDAVVVRISGVTRPLAQLVVDRVDTLGGRVDADADDEVLQVSVPLVDERG